MGRKTIYLSISVICGNIENYIGNENLSASD
jgi:hypothetical protein